MKLASFTLDGRDAYGLVTADGVHPAPADFRARRATLADVLRAGETRALATVCAAEPPLDPDTLRYLPVIPRPGKILCVGVNYLEHIREMGRERPSHPTLFTRFPDSLVGHGQPVVRPANSQQFDYEGELALVIGRPARHVAPDEVLQVVAGWTAFLDGSVRDWQRHTTQFTAGKNFPASGSCGPWLLTTDELPDPSGMRLETRVSGELLQSAPVSDLCFGIADIVAYVSSFCRLEPGDIIATGTPGGVGSARQPPRWLVPGDVVEVSLSGLGVLRNPVVAEESQT